jgi:sarcosine oxidase
MKNTFDCIVVGGGSMGSSTAYQLAKRGQKVLVLEQFDFIHGFGAHGGQSRLIRKAYFEHPDYVPLLLRAYENWAQLEKETQQQVYFPTGILYFGEKGDALLESIKNSARIYELPLNVLDTPETKQKYPMFSGVPDDWESIFEPEAGFLLPEKCVRLYLQEAIKHGATLKAREKVTAWQEKTDGQIAVTTEKATYYAQKIIFTAGAWSEQLMHDLQLPLKVTRQILGWVQPQNWPSFVNGKMPCWAISDKEKGLYYGMPILQEEDAGGPLGFKLGCHKHGDIVQPDTVDRNIYEADENTFRDGLQQYMPAANGETLSIKTCLYTNTPDENFIIDQHPHYKNVVFACGFSGHGFKFVSVVGEILSDLALEGETQQPIGFLRLRFRGQDLPHE